VGKLASIPGLSFVVNRPNTRKTTIMATENIRKPFPNTAAPMPSLPG